MLSFIVSEKNRKKRWTMYWRFDLKIREQFIVSAFSLTVWQTYLHILINVYWNEYGLIRTSYKWHCCLLLFLAWLITESVYNDAFRTFTFSMQQCIVYMTKKIRIILLIRPCIYFAYKSFVWTAALGLKFSGSNDIVLILPLY